MTQRTKLLKRGGSRKPVKKTWSRKFLELAGSAPDFPYPEELPPAEPGPEVENGPEPQTEACGTAVS
jgi:hypothetical protein